MRKQSRTPVKNKSARPDRERFVKNKNTRPDRDRPDRDRPDRDRPDRDRPDRDRPDRDRPDRDRPVRNTKPAGRTAPFRERESEATSVTNEQVEGRHPVIEALKSGRDINKILMAEKVEGGSSNEILSRAREKGIVVQRVPRIKLESIAQTSSHQGVVAYLAAKEYVELEALIARATQTDRPGLILVLDEIEDPHNLGSIIRSAEGAGAQGVVIPKRRAVPLTAIVAKSSAGAIEHMPVARVANLSQALEQLKKSGFWVVGTDVDAQALYHQVDMTGPTVIVIGNEGKGLGEVLKKRCDHLVRLPMIGQVSSLNAGVAAGILTYEAIRQRAEKK